MDQRGFTSCGLLPSDEGGIRKSALVNWYLKETESEIETMDQLGEVKTIVEKVIDRLAHHVSAFIIDYIW